MIRAENWITIEFDAEGQKKIAEAIETMETICDAIGGITSCCDWSDKLREAVSVLDEMLRGEKY